MTRPILDQNSVSQLECFAKSMQNKGVYAPLNAEIEYNGQKIQTRCVMDKENSGRMLGDECLRAEYSPKSKEIQVPCVGVQISKTDRALCHNVCVVGHELLHAIQHDSFTKDQIQKASQLGKESEKTNSSEDYAAYISCAVELPAHAVMIALELRNEKPADFSQSARDTHIYKYFLGKLNGAPSAKEVLENLIAEAKDMHAEIM